MTAPPHRKSLVLLPASLFFLTMGTAYSKQNPSNPRPFFIAVDNKLDKKQALSPAELARLKVLAANKDIFVRAHAITTLSWSKDKQGRQAADHVAHAYLKDPEPLVRHAALNALRRAQSPTARDAAKQMVNDPDEKVRESANKILGKTS